MPVRIAYALQWSAPVRAYVRAPVRVRAPVSGPVCVCVCVCVRARARVRACMHACMIASVPLFFVCMLHGTNREVWNKLPMRGQAGCGGGLVKGELSTDEMLGNPCSTWYPGSILQSVHGEP
jgi:hypothetical protein